MVVCSTKTEISDEIERQIINGWLVLARGETALAQEHTQLASTRIASSGCALYKNTAARLSGAIGFLSQAGTSERSSQGPHSENLEF